MLYIKWLRNERLIKIVMLMVHSLYRGIEKLIEWFFSGQGNSFSLNKLKMEWNEMKIVSSDGVDLFEIKADWCTR